MANVVPELAVVVGIFQVLVRKSRAAKCDTPELYRGSERCGVEGCGERTENGGDDAAGHGGTRAGIGGRTSSSG